MQHPFCSQDQSNGRFLRTIKEKKTHGQYVSVQLTSPFSICSTMLPNSVISSESDIVNIPINRDACTEGVYKRPREDSPLLRTQYQPKPPAAQGCGSVSPDTLSLRQEQAGFYVMCHINSTLCATGVCPESGLYCDIDHSLLQKGI